MSIDKLNEVKEQLERYTNQKVSFSIDLPAGWLS